LQAVHHANHFPDIRKKVKIGSEAEREIEDIMLTRYACYLIAQNGDPRKEQIAFAQSYFAVQTRKQELIEERIALIERFLESGPFPIANFDILKIQR
jgi:DNA-damage-inducible protein D